MVISLTVRARNFKGETGTGELPTFELLGGWFGLGLRLKLLLRLLYRRTLRLRL